VRQGSEMCEPVANAATKLLIATSLHGDIDEVIKREGGPV
jgi:hypothetical protein